MQDAAFCVCARLIEQIPLVWVELTRRAAILRPRNPTLWFGKLVLVSVSVSDIEKFAARSHHLMPARALLLRDTHGDSRNNGRDGKDGGNPSSAPVSSRAVGMGSTADASTNNITTSATTETISSSTLSNSVPIKMAPAALTAGSLSIDPTQSECLAACYFFTVTTPALRRKYPQVIEVRPLNHEEGGERLPGSSGSSFGTKKRNRVGRDGEIKRPLTCLVGGTTANQFTFNACEVSATSSKDGEFCRQPPIEGDYLDENSEEEDEFGGDREGGGSRKRLSTGPSLVSRLSKKRKLTRVGIMRPLYSTLHSSKLNGKAETNGNDKDGEFDEDEEGRDDDVDDEGLDEENIDQRKWNRLFSLLMRTNDSEDLKKESSIRQQPQPVSLAPVMSPSIPWGSLGRPLNLIELAAQAHVTAFITRRKCIEALFRRPLLYEFHTWYELNLFAHDTHGVGSDDFPRPDLPTSSSSAPTLLERIHPSTEESESQAEPVVDFKEKFNPNDTSSCLHPTRFRSFWNPRSNGSSTSTFMLPSLMPRPASLVTCDFLLMRLLICATWLTVYVDVLLPRLAYLEKKQTKLTGLIPDLFADSESPKVTTCGATINEESTSDNTQITNRNLSRGATEVIPDRGLLAVHSNKTKSGAYDTNLIQTSACVAFCARIVKIESRKYGCGSKRGHRQCDRGLPLLCPVCDEELHNSTHIKFAWSALREDREMLWKRMDAFMEVMRAEGYVSPSDSFDTEDEAETQQPEKSGGLESEVSQPQDSTFPVHHEMSAKHHISLRAWWNVFVGATSAREVVESTLRYSSSSPSTFPAWQHLSTCADHPEGAVTGLSEMDVRGRHASSFKNVFHIISGTLSYTGEEIINVRNCFFRAMAHRMHDVVEELCVILLLSSKDSRAEEMLARNSGRNKTSEFAANVLYDKAGNDGGINCPQPADPKGGCSSTKNKAAFCNVLLEKYRWLHRANGVKTTSPSKKGVSHEKSKMRKDTGLSTFSSPYTHGEGLKNHLKACSLRQLVLEVVLGGCSVEHVALFLFPSLYSYQKCDVKEGQEVAPLPEHYKKQQREILELLDFIPSTLPPLQEEDGILECARCLTLFHQHCVGPFQRDFIMGYFLCHTCRLLISQKPY
ncbi:unnamed protein product [Phytomonas sp. EM1]|nr:unnamed protein product [Phytomonas sp. EM1]|eukprot:CCW61099.1 unnamed protein product [Phytomonas sp. isolate EM1]